MSIGSDILYSGGEIYYITFISGRYAVKRVELELVEILYVGTYEECRNYFEKILKENVDYDLNL